MISSPFILNLNSTTFSMVLLNQSLRHPVYLLKFYHTFSQFTRADRLNLFIQPNSFYNYESMLNSLHFKSLYPKRQNLDALILINVFKNKIGCSITDIVCLRVPAKQIRKFSTFNVSSVSSLSPLTTSVTVANICKSLDFSINITSF
jgi:hypothetical protein